MATINFSQNSYAGEVLEDLLTYSATGNDTYKEGLVHIKTNIQHRYILPSVSLDDIIQDNKPTPMSPASNSALSVDSKGQYTFRERYLEPGEFMVYIEFDPRDFEKYWRTFQPEGNLVFRDLDPKLQAKMLRLLMDRKNEYIGEALWMSTRGGHEQSHTTSPEGSAKLGDKNFKYFDGFIQRILTNIKENVEGETVVVAGTTKLETGEQVEAALYTMWTKCPKQIRKKSGLSFLTGWDVWDLYDQYLSSKTVKYSENTDVNKYKFKGKRIVPLMGISDHTILLGEFSTSMDSNLWVGVDYANDTEVIRIDRLQANSELYFFQMRMKMDTNIVRPAEIVVHTAYANAA